MHCLVPVSTKALGAFVANRAYKAARSGIRGMTRQELSVFGAPITTWVFDSFPASKLWMRWAVRLTEMVWVSREISAHRRAQTSPIRSPVRRAR